MGVKMTKRSAVYSFTAAACLIVASMACSGGGGSDSSGSSAGGGDSSGGGAGSGGGSPAGVADFGVGHCGTNDLDQGNLALLDSLFKDFLANQRVSTRPKDTFAPIPTIVHVITKGDTYDDGNVPDGTIAQQIDVLNSVYAGSLGGMATPFRFALQGIDRVNKPEWFTVAPGSQAEIDLKMALRKAGRRH